jgi:hypothetical protein
MGVIVLTCPGRPTALNWNPSTILGLQFRMTAAPRAYPHMNEGRVEIKIPAVLQLVVIVDVTSRIFSRL